MKRILFTALLMLFAGELSGLCQADDNTEPASKRIGAEAAKSSLSYRYFRRYGESDSQASNARKYYPVAQRGTEIKMQAESKNPGERDAKDGRIANASKANGIWTRKTIHELRYDIREQHSVAPADRSSELNYGSGDWNQFYASPKIFAWSAPDIRYQPLYFEDVALERYGQTTGCNSQPIRSAIHFFNSVVFLPNHIRHDRSYSCDYPLGFCRPGSNVPGTRQIQYLGRPR